MPDTEIRPGAGPHCADIQAHYDLSDDFFGVFQDPTPKYSCAYFTGPNVTLSEAQVANVDLPNAAKIDRLRRHAENLSE